MVQERERERESKERVKDGKETEGRKSGKEMEKMMIGSFSSQTPSFQCVSVLCVRIFEWKKRKSYTCSHKE